MLLSGTNTVFDELAAAICEIPGFDPQILLDIYLEAEPPMEQTALFLLEKLVCSPAVPVARRF